MEYKIEYTSGVLKDLERLPPEIVNKALSIISEKLAKAPSIGIPLKGPYKGLRKFRFGNYRIIYTIVEKNVVVLILRIRHRKDVYRGIF